MKFKFRLERILRQRKLEQDIANREYQKAQENVRKQLHHIENLYAESDKARAHAGQITSNGGTCAMDLQQVEEFIIGQKVIIRHAREEARKLMAVSEEKQEVLVEKMRNLKILEKLRENKHLEFKTSAKKRETKEADNLTTMTFPQRGVK